MGKTLNFTHDGKNYTLEFTRMSVIATEKMGFRVAGVYETPVSSLSYLWHGAFLAHHPDVSFAEREALLDKISQKKKDAKQDEEGVGLLDTLLDLYTAPIKSLSDEEHAKNAIEWTVT